MSVLKAKRMADLKEAIEEQSKIIITRHAEARKKIDSEVSSSFEGFMSVNGFETSKSAYGVKATYKTLAVELKLAGPDDQYIGVYHSFSIFIDRVEHEVDVLAKFTGEPDTYAHNTDTVEGLEHNLARLEYEVSNQKLESFEFSLRPRKGSAPARGLSAVRASKKATIADLLEELLS